jgi:hypothetical protein
VDSDSRAVLHCNKYMRHAIPMFVYMGMRLGLLF